ncbi:MAG: hypothetical protein RL088_3230 [Verrucomicrobiota bacterium]
MPDIQPAIFAASVLASLFCLEANASEPVQLPGIANAFRVTDRILSGSQPGGDAAFRALADLGVKTIVSVDGAKPDLETARRFGLRYIHLPIGYDGVPQARVPELAKVAQKPAEGLIFVHCHHGKHRGPTAVAIMCEIAEGWSPAKAEEWLRKAGTGTEYAGLYRSVLEFKPVTKEQIAAVGPLPEIAKTPGIVDAMIAIDEHFDLLKEAQRAGWQSAPGDATLLLEQYREIARLEDTAKRNDSYRALLAKGTEAATQLAEALRTHSADKADAAIKELRENCAACHKEHRNQRK